MRVKKYNFMLITLSIVIICFAIVTTVAKYSVKNQEIDLTVEPSKSSYVLGEVIELQFTIKNNSSEPIRHNLFYRNSDDEG